jgi:hypothetical protein
MRVGMPSLHAGAEQGRQRFPPAAVRGPVHGHHGDDDALC